MDARTAAAHSADPRAASASFAFDARTSPAPAFDARAAQPNRIADAPPSLGMPGAFAGAPVPVPPVAETPVPLLKQVLMYALAMFLPPVGLIVGLVTMGRTGTPQRELGRAMVIIVVLQVVAVIIGCCCIYSTNMFSLFNGLRYMSF